MAGKDKMPLGRAEIFAAIGAATAAIGLLLMQLFVEPERLNGWTVPHIANIVLLSLAVVSAFIIVFTASGKIKRKKAGCEKGSNMESNNHRNI